MNRTFPLWLLPASGQAPGVAFRSLTSSHLARALPQVEVWKVLKLRLVLSCDSVPTSAHAHMARHSTGIIRSKLVQRLGVAGCRQTEIKA